MPKTLFFGQFFLAQFFAVIWDLVPWGPIEVAYFWNSYLKKTHIIFLQKISTLLVDAISVRRCVLEPVFYVRQVCVVMSFLGRIELRQKLNGPNFWLARKIQTGRKIFWRNWTVFSKYVDFKHKIECESIANYLRIVFSHISKHLHRIYTFFWIIK
jgi:hypothetical protein